MKNDNLGLGEIAMVDLKTQYKRLNDEFNTGINSVLEHTGFINGKEVGIFAEKLAAKTASKFVVPCANGTDALQLCFMALDFEPGSEVITAAFNYVAAAEVVAFVGLRPVFVDIDPQSFNIDPEKIESAITNKTKAIVVVHLFGQSAHMEPLIAIAKKYDLIIIEDNAQSIFSEYQFKDGGKKFTGTMTEIGTTSFFPSKNLGCFGDGGAVFSQDESLAKLIKKYANHGQEKKYTYDLVGINSRLDTIQAAILLVKLKHIDEFIASRQHAAGLYDELLSDITDIETPFRSSYSTHVFHQYTVKLPEGVNRNQVQEFLSEKGIPTMVYYPTPLHVQKAFKFLGYSEGDFPVSENLSKRVLSLPMHTELPENQQAYISETLKNFLSK